MRFRLLPLAAAALATLLLAPGSASAATCTFDSAASRVVLGLGLPGPETRLERGADGAIHVDGAACGEATVTNTDTIVASGGDGVQTLLVDLAGGPFAPGRTAEGDGSSEIEIQVDGGNIGEFPSGDEVRILGTSGADVLQVDGTGVRLNDDADADVTTKEVEALGLVGNGRSDRLLGGASTIPLALHGGTGNDTLEGGETDDTLSGGPGDDTESGNGGTDRFDQGAADDGGDVLDGGASPFDVIDYSSRTRAVRIDLDGDADDGEAGELDEVVDSFEYLEGGAGGDTIVASRTRYQPFNIKGHGGDDEVIGGANFDWLEGGAGDDRLRGGESSDTFWGGPGADTMIGGESSDIFREGDDLGPSGADDMQGGAGVDTYFASARPDPLTIKLDNVANDGGAGERDNVRADVENIVAGRANDVVRGSVADNYVDGGPGDDEVAAGDGRDEVYGYAGADTLDGGAGTDVLRGGEGADRLSGGTGTDAVYGEEEDDLFLEPASADGADRLFGGFGTDRVSYGARSTPVAVTLDGVADDGAAGEGDLVDAEGVSGGRSADRLVGSEGENRLDGGGGADDLDGRGGSDVLTGGPGGDDLLGGEGTDTTDYSESPARVVVTVGTGADDGAAGEGDDVQTEDVLGSRGADILTGDGTRNRLDGGPGDDVLDGDVGADVLVGGEGSDTASYARRRSAVMVTLDAVAADGELSEGDLVESTVEQVTGGDGDDRLVGDGRANTLSGRGGHDRLDGGEGPDRLVGGSGRDVADYHLRTVPVFVSIDDAADDGAAGEGDEVDTTIEVVEGGFGDDRLTGGRGDDELRGMPGHDVLSGGPGGDDVLSGHLGHDTVTYADRGSEEPVMVTIDGIANDGDQAGGEHDDVRDDVEALVGGSGDDDLRGSDQANTLTGGPGDDSLSGRGGDDRFDAGARAPGRDGDHFFGGEGRDLADYSARGQGLRISLDHIDDDGEPARDGVPAERDNVHADVEDVTTGRGADVIVGGDGDNGLDGGGFNDRLEGRGGNDALTGGGGGDRLFGEAGDDRLAGGTSLDVLTGGDGHDTFDEGSAANGADRFAGGPGRDVADYSDRSRRVLLDNDGSANDGEDDDWNSEAEERDTIATDIEVLRGGDSWDWLVNRQEFPERCGGLDGGAGNDTLSGRGGNEAIWGGHGEDKLRGEGGNDILSGGPGADSENGGDGDDTFIQGTFSSGCSGISYRDVAGSDGGDYIVGEGGRDTVDYRRTSDTDLVVRLDDRRNDGVEGERDDVRVENLSGGDGDDLLVGDGDDNRIAGARGTDRIEGGGGGDQLWSGEGADTLLGQGGGDEFQTKDGDSADTLNGGDGDDFGEWDEGDRRVSVP